MEKTQIKTGWSYKGAAHYEVYITQFNSSEHSAYFQDGKWVIKNAEAALNVLMNEVNELRAHNAALINELNKNRSHGE